MNKITVCLLLMLLSIQSFAVTPWLKWGGAPYSTYVRMDNYGDVSCYSTDGGRNCEWLDAAEPTGQVSALSCGIHHKSLYGITGYETTGHWCNNVFGDLYATWKRGDYYGVNTFLSETPQGDLMCASSDGQQCAWDKALSASNPEKPVKPIVCGPSAPAPAGGATGAQGSANWCEQARLTVEERDYSNPKWANERFRFDKGWAGNGFGLSGSQRGAPESIKLGAREGRAGLAIMSLPRDAAWHQLTQQSAASLIPLYGQADDELQDDFFMYGKKAWVAADEPAVVMHVYLPTGNTTSLRMPVVHSYAGAQSRRWPGIWIKPQGVRVRTVVGDYSIPKVTAAGGAGTWWTLGMKITASGDIEYYGVPEWKVSPFDDAYLLSKQSTLLGTDAYKVLRQADAVVMISSVMPIASEILIGDIRYGMKTKGQKR